MTLELVSLVGVLFVLLGVWLRQRPRLVNDAVGDGVEDDNEETRVDEMAQIVIERTEPHLPTGRKCAECGKEVKARNRKAQKAIREYRGKGLKCACCFERQQ